MKTSLVISQGWSVRRSGEKFLWLRLAKEALEFAAACHGLGVSVRPFGGERVRISICPAEENDAFLAVIAVLARGRVVHSDMEEMVES